MHLLATYVVCGEVNVQEEDATLVRAVRRSHDGSRPVEEIVANGASAAVCGRIALEILQLFVDPLQGHCLILRCAAWLMCWLIGCLQRTTTRPVLRG